ncbi:WD repeat-containing protein [Aureococcus anophagefferens]|nr:WD repeat-containing protein [Aureococcus anophagefferens]
MGYGVSDVGQRRRKTQLAAKKNKRRSSVAAWEGDDGTGHIGNRQTRFMLERMKKDLEKLEAPREDLPEAKFTALQDAPKIRRRQSLAMWQADQEARVKAQEAETAAKIKAAAESGAAFFAFDHKPKEAVVPEEEAAPKEPSYGAAGASTTLTAPSVGSHKSSMQKSGATERSPLVARARQRALQGAASGQMAIAAVGAVAVGERAKDERRERTHPARDDSVFTCAGHRRECFSCACSNDGKLLASGGFGFVSAVAFSPDGASLATGCRDNLVRVFDLATGKIQLQLKGHTAYVSSVEFNVDGAAVSGSYDETAVVWNAVTGKKRMALLDKKSGHRKTNDIVHYVHHASYDRRGDRDKSARAWDAKTGDQLAVLLGHTHHITAVACLADGRLVTGAKDYTIRVWEDKWNVHNYDHRVLEGHADRVMAVALAQNDGLLVSASFDRTLKCWDPDPADELFVDRRYAAASAAEAEGLLSAQGSVSLAVSQQGSALEAVAEDGEESWLD